MIRERRSVAIRSMTAASASAASPPAEGGAMTTFAPSVRNSCVSFFSASKFTFNSAEQTAAPLASAISATVKRPRLAPSNFHKIRRNMDRVCTNSLSPQDRSRIGMRGACQRPKAAKKRHDRSEDQDYGEKDPAKCGSNTENSNSENTRQDDSDCVPKNTTNERQQELFGNKKSADGAM